MLRVRVLSYQVLLVQSLILMKRHGECSMWKSCKFYFWISLQLFVIPTEGRLWLRNLCTLVAFIPVWCLCCVMCNVWVWCGTVGGPPEAVMCHTVHEARMSRGCSSPMPGSLKPHLYFWDSSIHSWWVCEKSKIDFFVIFWNISYLPVFLFCLCYVCSEINFLECTKYRGQGNSGQH